MRAIEDILVQGSLTFVKEKITLPMLYYHELLLPCFIRKEIYQCYIYNKKLKYKNQLVTSRAEKSALTA
jgi:hypothetical protein